MPRSTFTPRTKGPAESTATSATPPLDRIALLEADEADLAERIRVLQEQLDADEAAFAAGELRARDRIRDARSRLTTLEDDIADTRTELSTRRIDAAVELDRLCRLENAESVVADSEQRLKLAARLSAAATEFLSALDALHVHADEAQARIYGSISVGRDPGLAQKRNLAMEALSLRGSEIAHAMALFSERVNQHFEGSLFILSGWTFSLEDGGPWRPTRFVEAAERQNAMLEHRVQIVVDLIENEAPGSIRPAPVQAWFEKTADQRAAECAEAGPTVYPETPDPKDFDLPGIDMRKGVVTGLRHPPESSR